jgi:hypothetical protein
MDPLTAVTILKSVGVFDWFKSKFGDSPTATVAKKVVDTAALLSGAKNGAEAIKLLAEDQKLAATVAEGIKAEESVLVRLMLDDVKDARHMYIETGHTQANKVADQIMTWNLPMIVALICANIGALVYITDTAMAVAVGNLIGASIQAAWAERQQVAGFFLGSSLGSMMKNK